MLSITPKSSISNGVPFERGYDECGHSCNVFRSENAPLEEPEWVPTYMIHGKKLSFVLENHNLILRISSLGVFPVVYGYFAGLGAVVAWNVKYATSWNSGPST